MLAEKPKIVKYKKLSDKVLEGNRQQIYNQEYLDDVTELLDWNPELYTAWNYRKRLILHYVFRDELKLDEQTKHEFLTNELAFVLKMLKRFPKSYWIWNHRIWCLKLDTLSNWDVELGLVEKFLQVDARNFHVWAYRRLIIQLMKIDENVKVVNEEIDLDEFKFTTKLINRDISNYSAWHNRTKLVEMLFDRAPQASAVGDSDKELQAYLQIFNSKDKAAFLRKELDLVKKAIYTDPEDSSVWFYLKWLMSEYFLKDITNKEDMKSIIFRVLSDVKELNELEYDDNNVDNKWCLISLVYLAKQLHCIADSDVNMPEVESYINKLKESDPMRKGMYESFSLEDPLTYKA